MHHIYLVRHAQSVANIGHIFQGHTYNTGLSPLGVSQAKLVGAYLAQRLVERVVSSPLKRAMETAEVISQSYEVDPALIETDHGQWEGLREVVVKLRWPEIYQTWMTNPARAVFPGGEKFTDVQDRVLVWWDKLDKNQDLVLVSHENILQIIIAHVAGWTLDDIWKFILPNASVTTLEVSGGKARVVDVANVSHLVGAKI